ncbi:MAG: hypothetical protein AAF633_10010 [Chloroflexota bacterium]
MSNIRQYSTFLFVFFLLGLLVFSVSLSASAMPTFDEPVHGGPLPVDQSTDRSAQQATPIPPTTDGTQEIQTLLYLPLVFDQEIIVLPTETPIPPDNTPVPPTLTPTPSSSSGVPDDVACMLIVTRTAWYEFCETKGNSVRTELRNDEDTGALIGIDISITTDNTPPVHYAASVDFINAETGRLLGYTASVSGDDTSAYSLNVSHQYNEFGGLIGSAATKVYASGETYTLDITPCERGTSWSGYDALVTGNGLTAEPYSIGDCS